MKHLIFTFVTLILVNIVRSQEKEVLTCKYMVATKQDGAVEKNELFTLSIGQTISKYFSDTKRIGDSILRSDYQAGLGLTPQNIAENKTRYGLTADPTIVYNSINTRSLTVYEDVLTRKYVYQDTFPVTNWKILPDTLTINGMKCQKAIIKFRGRNYSAWFSIEIASSFGPWKFYGLPGLIVKVSDSENKFSFTLVSLEKNTVKQDQDISVFSGNAIKASAREVSNLKRRAIEDPFGELELATGAKISVTQGMQELVNMIQNEKNSYNPIELYFDNL